jgi:hypothetical protein
MRIRLLPLLLGTLALLAPFAAHAATITLPQTGQVSCWDDTGAAVPCSGTGQDGENRTGLAWPAPRFIANADQTVTDSLTSLSWSRDADPTGANTWQGALDQIKTLNSQNYLGHNDWRLPNINELASLVNRQQASPALWLNSQGFANVLPLGYWSSTTSAITWLSTSDASSALIVDMFNGATGRYAKTGTKYVWPVRGGQSGSPVLAKTGQISCYNAAGTAIACAGTGQDGELRTGAAWPVSRFTVNGDETVTDNLTGLSWVKGPGRSATNRQIALDYIKILNSQNYLGQNDWRLPNIDELTSLVNRQESDPSEWLASQGFGTVDHYHGYCSSTILAGNPRDTWRLDIGFGDTAQSYSTGTSLQSYCNVCPVRGGERYSLPVLFIASSGSGTVTPSTGSITWAGESGSAGYASGTVVTLTAAPANGSSFNGWTGCDSSSGTSCTVTMNAARSVSVTFTLNRADGACGSANGNTAADPPRTGLCSSGTATGVSGTGPWDWSCQGIAGGSSQNCSAAVAPASAFITQLPKTGQTACWDIGGTPQNCYHSWQDGEYRKGMAWPEPRFTPNAEQTVTDNLTGLIWSREANLRGNILWQEALDYINFLNRQNFLGHNDWRLPNIKELESLVNRAQSGPDVWLNSQGFSNVQADYYWSATTSYLPQKAMVVKMSTGVSSSNGKVGGCAIVEICRPAYVWPVRSEQTGTAGALTLPKTGQTACYDATGSVISCAGTGQDGELQVGAPWPNPRFTVTDNTITDNLTKLVWMRDANPLAAVQVWQQATDHMQDIININGLHGHADWRLPNINELASLNTYQTGSPDLWLTEQGFLNVNDNYWSSTTYMPETESVANYRFAWNVSFHSFTEDFYKSGFAYVWPVRAGEWEFPALAVTRSGSGSVTPSAGVFSWTGSTGTASYLPATAVTLTATADSGSHFVSWTGCDSSSGDSCTVTMNGSRNVTATFILNTANGVCGTANGGVFDTPPVDNLCDVGTPSSLSGAGPWTWTCPGWGGGTNASCSANIKTYAVGFAAGANGSLSGIASQSVKYGSNAAAVTAVPAPRYHFVNWTGSLTSTANPLTIVGVTSAINVTANFALDRFTLDFATDGHGLVIGGASQTVDSGAAAATVTAVPIVGYHFVNWTEGGTIVGTDPALAITNVSAPHTYTANFAANTYEVTFTPGTNGTLNGAVSQTIPHGGSITTVTAVPATRYHFVNWTEGSTVVSSSAALTRSNITATHAYTANFAIDTFTVTFATGGNGTVSGTTSQTVSVGANAAAVTALPATGYHFVNWTEGASVVSTEPTLSITNVTAPHNYRANFVVNALEVSFASGGNGTLTGTASQTVSYGGSTSVVTAVPAADYHFVNWTEGTKVISSNAALVVNNVIAPHSYKANFAINTVTITFTSAGNGTLTGSATQEVNVGAGTTPVTAVPATGYHFVSWTEGTTVVGNSVTLSLAAVTAAHRYTANFAINSYTVDFSSSGNGTLSGSVSQSINHGSNATTVTAVPANHYHFVNWSEGATVLGTDAALSASNITATHNYMANFAIDTYPVTFASGGNGTINGETSQTVAHGASAATVTAVPAVGYTFVNWKEGGNVVSTSTVLSLSNIAAARSLTATFTLGPVNGVCGTSNNGSFITAPTANLCTSGTASPLTGSGPWSWKCTGANGGSSTDCAANLQQYTVTPAAAAGSTITPQAPQTLNHGSTAKFTVAPAEGYGIIVSGCSGTLRGITYTTGVITTDCSVNVTTVPRTARGTDAAQPTMVDALKALQAYSGKLTLSPEERIRYDVAPLGSSGAPVGNGAVDVADIILILRRTIGIGTW